MHNQNLVINSNIHFLEQGIDLLSSLSDNVYIKNNTRYNKSGVGKHFRHIIEHYQSLFNSDGSVINYDKRQRNKDLETNRLLMIKTFTGIISELKELKKQPEKLDTFYTIRSNEGIGEENSPLSSATMRRELQFLISHTVHHYALIGLILQTMGINPDESFGVAPSTLKYEMEQKASNNASHNL